MSSRGDLRRGRPTRTPRQRILVYCEGENTEPEYFRGLKKYLRAIPVDIVTCDIKGIGCDPLKIVKEAEIAWARDRRKNGAECYDAVWCVVDHDDHPSLRSAVEYAARAGIGVVVSTPCFEYWLLLHFDDHRAHVRQSEVTRSLRRHLRG
ncbi:hypothetical protein [Alloactinosynnema sp. L-07]|uniref:RloB family protein n=1 Tax=Alloactinosynnema sp. L-07 TaxID=1653480 RepID=UPI00065F0A40|nr:hypothetical protein [Alloactinosynnema sp. L-07]